MKPGDNLTIDGLMTCARCQTTESPFRPTLVWVRRSVEPVTVNLCAPCLEILTTAAPPAAADGGRRPPARRGVEDG